MGVVSLRCIDGQWREPLPNKSASLNAVKATFSGNNYNRFVLDVLKVRYPTGKYVVEGGLAKKDCIGQFLDERDKESASGIIDSLSTIVHECGHMHDSNRTEAFNEVAYVLTPKVAFVCSGASYVGVNHTFARSLLNGDIFSAQRPPCLNEWHVGCDFYASYLDGNPMNDKFENGDQGFDMVLEETVQYVNSLATHYAYEDQQSTTRSVSARDGILTFLWYTERYLRMARLQYPDQYQFLTGDPCWREAILSTWGRAWTYLALTANSPSLGIDSQAIEMLVRDPRLLIEISFVRMAQGCK